MSHIGDGSEEGALQAASALDATSCCVIITDATFDNLITYANDAFCELSGFTQAEIIGRNCRFLQGPDTDPLATAEIRAALTACEGVRREILNYRKDGTPFWNDLRVDPIRDAAGSLIGFVGVQNQVDTAHRIFEEKAEVESRIESIADHVPGYIYRRVMHTDGQVEIAYCSPSISKLLGAAEVDVAKTFYSYVHPDDLAPLLSAVRRSAADMSVFREEFRLISPSGATHWLRSEAPPRRMSNGEIVWDGLAIEISGEKRWESEIASLALRDTLTGLLSRTAWRQAITMRLAGDTPRCGLIYFDIAGFHDLNERFGQRAGDDIIREVAQRLSLLADSVGGAAARLGGDEFAVLIPGCADAAALSRIAASAMDDLARPMRIGANDLAVLTRVGASLYEGHGPGAHGSADLAGELKTQARLALRWAKLEGGGPVLYSSELDDRFQNQALLAKSLDRAIADNQLELHYQPLVDLASGRIVSAEALVRWKHPTLGMQRPDLFIPIAEASGLIVPLGRWVVEEACRQHAEWREAGLAPPPLAINVSGLQLLSTGFVAFIEEALKRVGADARDFEIELTEGLLIEPSPQIMASLHALRAMGLTITIDDFGSGHASFRYLRDFPVDKLKIDQVFVRQLVLGSTDAMIIRAVISLAGSMRIGLVAEGVETDMQRAFLQREGCTVGQGYLFSMPLVAEDFAWMLANGVRLPLRGPAGRPGEAAPPEALEMETDNP